MSVIEQKPPQRFEIRAKEIANELTSLLFPVDSFGDDYQDAATMRQNLQNRYGVVVIEGYLRAHLDPSRALPEGATEDMREDLAIAWTLGSVQKNMHRHTESGMATAYVSNEPPVVIDG
ncbi:MAG TPA: hypothetical protein VLF87_03510 [Patescibacteria group bacterium]|nr:hypothetical protein [Patescibacteria group bacterium]